MRGRRTRTINRESMVRRTWKKKYERVSEHDYIILIDVYLS